MKEKENRSKKQLAYNGIRKMILNGGMKTNTPLVEKQLCDQLGISRTPVREALRELANEGLVELIDGKGVFVKRIEFRDMIEIFEMREALERMAIRLFVERADDDSVAQFRQYVEEQEKAHAQEDHAAFMDCDRKIHSLIAEGAKNGRLKCALANIYDQMTQITVSVRDDKRVRDMAIQEHRKILDAVLRNDSRAAEEAVAEHIVQVKQMHIERYYLL